MENTLLHGIGVICLVAGTASGFDATFAAGNLTGTTDGVAFPIAGGPSEEVHSGSTQSFTSTSGGGQTDAGLLGVMASEASAQADITSAAGSGLTTIRLLTEGMATFNDVDYFGSIGSAVTLNLFIDIDEATAFSIEDGGDFANGEDWSFTALTGSINGDMLGVGQYQLAVQFGVFVSTNLGTSVDTHDGLIAIRLPAPGAALGLGLGLALAGSRRRRPPRLS